MLERFSLHKRFFIPFLILGLLFSTQSAVSDIIYPDVSVPFIWTPATGSPEFYKVYVSWDGGQYAFVETTPTTSYTLTGENQHTYQIKVQAADSQGNVGPMSDASPRVTINIAGSPRTPQKARPEGENPLTPWDVNNDGVVNLFDLVAVALQLGQVGQNLRGDLNRDGVVNVFDLVAISSHFGESSVAPAPILVNVRHVANLSTSNYEQIRYALAELEAMRDDLIAIEFLRTWLASANSIPAETRLLENYPNPFNPETWIPYQLASDSEVQIAIYDIKGRLVRQLKLGHQRTGYYVDRNRAAYWDGRDEAGEFVASGLYFYRLRADDLTAVKRLVVLK